MDKQKKFEILDCTIRDGGYLNNWYFNPKLVRELYRAHSMSGVGFFEIGFRSNTNYFDGDKFGPWRYSPESLISEIIDGISGPPIALMVDFGKVDTEDIPLKANSPVSMYRVAVHKDKVIQAIELCDEIKEKGYLASIQLMGIVNYREEDYDEIIEPLKESLVDYVYFADSYGSLFPSNVKPILDRLRATEKKLGFHAHNNLQLAFANTLEALRCGVDIVDGTAFGMGRGAGNLPIETLLTYLEKHSNMNRYNVLPVLDVIDHYFLDLHKEFEWGYDLSYMMAGMFEVHPTYSKTMVDYREYSMEDILRALETVKRMSPIGFKKEILDSIIQSGLVGDRNFNTNSYVGTKLSSNSSHNEFEKVSYLDRFKGRLFLILANGPTLEEYKDFIEEFINKYDPVVIGSNYLNGLFTPHYHSFANRRRFVDYIDTVDARSNILISNSIPERFIKEYTDREYEVIQHVPELLPDFDIKDGVIMTNCRTISILSIATAIVMGADRIFIAGMDGYKHVDSFMKSAVHFYKEPGEPDNFEILMEKHNWNERLLYQINKYLMAANKEGLSILTPTSHRTYYRSFESL